MRTLSLDLRQRILDSYDNNEGTRAEIAQRFRVTLGMVKKWLRQRRRTGDIAPRHHFAGRKPMIQFPHRNQIPDARRPVTKSAEPGHTNNRARSHELPRAQQFVRER